VLASGESGEVEVVVEGVGERTRRGVDEAVVLELASGLRGQHPGDYICVRSCILVYITL
jgi:hypothetical protein